MKQARFCATDGCSNAHTARSHWCAACRASLRRWLGMSDTQRTASWGRAEYRWNRVQAFRAGRRRQVA